MGNYPSRSVYRRKEAFELGRQTGINHSGQGPSQNVSPAYLTGSPAVSWLSGSQIVVLMPLIGGHPETLSFEKHFSVLRLSITSCAFSNKQSGFSHEKNILGNSFIRSMILRICFLTAGAS